MMDCNQYGELPFHTAAIEGNMESVRYFLHQGIDVNATSFEGFTCLHYAALHGHMDIIRILVEYGAIIHIRRVLCGTMPIHLAALFGHVKCVEYFLDGGITVNICNTKGVACLHNAARSGHLDVVKFLSDRGANLHARCGDKSQLSIHNAASEGHTECVSFFVDHGIDVNLTDTDGFSPLMYAAIGGHLDIVKLLVKQGANMEIRCNKYSNTPMHSAAFVGQVECMEYLVVCGYNMEALNGKGSTCLHCAACGGHLQLVKLLTAHGANMYAQCAKYSNLPIHSAALEGHTECVEYFLDQGLDINLTNNQGMTCLHNAVCEGHVQTAKRLIERGAYMNISNKTNGNLPAHSAALSCRTSCLELLIDSGFNINLWNEKGFSCLHIAASRGHVAVVRLLMERGADANIRCMKSGNTPVHTAAYLGHIKCVEYFLENQADVESRNSSGQSILHCAAAGGQLEVIEMLVERGADIHSVCLKYENSLLHIVIQNGHKSCVEYFLKKSIDVNRANKQNSTPITIAALQGDVDMVESLVSNGADINIATGVDRNTPLHSAAKNGHIECVKSLLDHGALTDVHNLYHQTPYDVAMSNQRLAEAYLFYYTELLRSVEDQRRSPFSGEQ